MVRDDSDLLAELAQIEHVDYVKQANNANLAKVDGLGIYARVTRHVPVVEARSLLSRHFDSLAPDRIER